MYCTRAYSISILALWENKASGPISINLFLWLQDVFAVYPRIDLIHQNMVWQQTYSKVNYAHAKECSQKMFSPFSYFLSLPYLFSLSLNELIITHSLCLCLPIWLIQIYKLYLSCSLYFLSLSLSHPCFLSQASQLLDRCGFEKKL